MKLQLEELRIGNWINTIEGPVQAWGMMKEGIMSTSYYEGGDLLSFAEPIPLTEEWLQRLGILRYDKRQDIFYDGLFQIRIELHNGIFEMYSYSEDTGHQWHLITIEFVHQLQNLYFALTGKELTIKE